MTAAELEARVAAFLTERVAEIQAELASSLAHDLDIARVEDLLALLDAMPSASDLDKAALVRALADRRIPAVRTFALSLRPRLRDADAVQWIDEALERFPGSPPAPRVSIGGRAVRPEEVSYRDPNFGIWRPTDRAARFQLEIGSETLTTLLAPLYDQHAEDDRTHGEGEDNALILRLRGLGWPPLATLIQSEPSAVSAFFVDHLAWDAMVAIFRRRPDPHRYYINQIDRIAMADGVVTFAGRAVDVGDDANVSKRTSGSDR